MVIWGGGEIYLPIFLFGIMAMIAAYFPRFWPLGVLAGIGIAALLFMEN